VGRENSLFRKIRRAVIGVPVYKGHPDNKIFNPSVLDNSGDKMIKLGVADAVRKGAKGVEAHFALDQDGAAAVENENCKYPSGMWLVQPTGELRDGAIVCTPFKLLSVGLTPYPNISGVESLANQRDAGPKLSNAGTPAGTGATHLGQQQTQEPDMKLIAGWLIAQGIALPNAEAPTETQVLEAFQKLHTAKAGEVVSLGNEKSTLAGQITTLTNERDAQKKLATDNATALANEQNKVKAERTRAATAAVDLAVHKGIVTVADRAKEITALENSAAFEADAKALLEKTATTKTTTNGSTESGKQEAALGNEALVTQQQYKTAFEAELIATGQNPSQAHQNIMKLPKYSGLAAKLVPAKKFNARQQTL
jgi:hypothetical protein